MVSPCQHLPRQGVAGRASGRATPRQKMHCIGVDRTGPRGVVAGHGFNL